MARLTGTVLLIAMFTTIFGANRGYASGMLLESQIDRYWQQAKHQVGTSSSLKFTVSYALSDSGKAETGKQDAASFRPKSPGKAFALSMLVPGLGQIYNGSKIKAVTFLGIEATSWILQFKWHGDGNRLTDDFETFQETHWSEPRYSEYLLDVYGYADDDSIIATEISHHLPDTRTQQYYEMTGKYDQFVWGWDDADLNGHGYAYYADTGSFVKAVAPNVPTSANRLAYETMRYDANKKFSNARKMIMVALGNRLVSALEAFISAKRSHDKRPSTGEGGGGSREFSHWKFQGKLKSVYARYDTPYLKVTYGF